MQTGNDPLKIIKELAAIGDLKECQLLEVQIPQFKLFDSEQCYLGWQIIVAGCDRQAIANVFEWVVDDCEHY